MLSLLRTPTEQLKWTSKREKPMVKAVRKRMRGECPVAGAGAPGSGAPRTLFLTAFTIGFSRFEVHFSCSVGVLRRDSISAHVWYGLRTNLYYPYQYFRDCFSWIRGTFEVSRLRFLSLLHPMMLWLGKLQFMVMFWWIITP